MMSRENSMVWNMNMEGGSKGDQEDEATASWAPQNQEEEVEMGPTFKSMLEAEADDWYISSTATASNGGGPMHDVTFPPAFADVSSQLLLHQTMDSSSSVFSNLEQQQHNNNNSSQVMNYFLPPKSLSSIPNNTLLEGTGLGFDLLGCGEIGFLESVLDRGGGGFNNEGFGQMGSLNLGSNSGFASSNSSLMQLQPQGIGGFGFGEGISNFFNRSKILKPLDDFGGNNSNGNNGSSNNNSSGSSQPTLFQKRAALKKNLANGGNLGSLNIGGNGGSLGIGLKSPSSASNVEGSELSERKRRRSVSVGGDDLEDLSVDGSNLNYDSDDVFLENTVKLEESGRFGGGSGSNANSAVTGEDQKGKKKGLPAKNLMAERRRRRKLNDRLYMLRSVVPKISKMDRASILGDAIDYLKELLQKINDLHNELESIPGGSSVTPTTSFHPLAPSTPGLSPRIKEELCPSALPSPMSGPTGQPARVEVKMREGRAVNIHMFCGRRPGLLLSTMRAIDNLGLDVQQAVISCFNGFALDIFRAEQCRDGQELHPDQIKAVLLDSAGFHGMI